MTHLRSFTCQPYTFSDSGMHFIPTANATPCGVHEPPAGLAGAHPEHPMDHP